MQGIAIRRRSLLRLSGVGVAGAAVAAASGGCAADSGPQPTASTAPGRSTALGGRPAVLVAYFSRAGWNYHNGGRRFLRTGNTQRLADMIGELIGCDVHRIEAADPYSDDYDETVARNVREQNADARPAIANPLPSVDRYTTVLLASGIWNVRAPMIMSTFAEGYDFTGKTVHPITTYAMSGLGTTERDYAASCRGATVATGLAVRGEEVDAAGPTVQTWLKQNNLISS
ncbi:flavodoxin [Micromonospora luteifusca]|uniref:Flavodoxin n=1 Tax=Micromonospora luteifusca TaxID=709860 RepID=A0ABS2LMK7_9ACTN|nr:flavodoxin [Micromonospora luteifusca]MBM7489385.1 flavodoxin [Micromonospora luteifusca]